MIPDPIYMTIAVQELEQRSTNLGWQGECAFGYMVQLPADNVTYQSGLFPLDLPDIDPHLEKALRKLADDMRINRGDIPDTDTDFTALWVAFAGQYECDGQTEWQSLRTVIAIDCGGFTYVVIRTPTGVQETSVSKPGQPTGMGEVATGLRDILLQAVVDLPSIGADLVKLSQVCA